MSIEDRKKYIVIIRRALTKKYGIASSIGGPAAQPLHDAIRNGLHVGEYQSWTLSELADMAEHAQRITVLLKRHAEARSAFDVERAALASGRIGEEMAAILNLDAERLARFDDLDD